MSGALANGGSVLKLMRLPKGDRRLLVDHAALAMGLAPAIVEKDLWVCYVLDLLFNRFDYAEHIIFKGGTSLSKCFGLIQRFSEDIDLILDWRLLGYGEHEPWEPRGNAAQERFKLDSTERTEAFLAESFAPKLKAAISAELDFDAKIYLGETSETVVFEYPSERKIAATLDVIKLEIGPMAAWSPSEEAEISPYAASALPGMLGSVSTMVRTASPGRTFWEKATILHQEANRPANKPMPRRYSRHYYDLYRLGHSFVLKRSLADFALLACVVEFKEKFYRTPWARLSEARPGSLGLVTPESRVPELEEDYEAIRPMLFGEFSSLGEIVAYLQELESEISGCVWP